MKTRSFFLLLTLALLLAACGPRQASTSGEQITEITAPEQETVVTYQDALTLVVPPGAVPAGGQLSISTVKDAPEFKFAGLKSLGTYEIKLGDAETFDQPLQLQFQYDPADLLPDLPAADQLVAAYLDEVTGAWMEVDCTVDEASQTVSVATQHLSLWSLFGLEDTTVVSSAPHFRIYFDTRMTGVRLDQKPSGAGLLYDFAAYVRSALVDAYDAYQKAPGSYGGVGFRQAEMTNVYLYHAANVDDAAEWGWFSKNIRVPDTYSTLAELRQDVAHELFHVIQNQYADVVTMHRNRWFMEASADYAAAAIGTTNGLGTSLGLDFIKKPLTDPEDKHMYRVSHFLQFIHQRGLDFKDLAESVSTGTDALGAMEGLADARGADLAELYADFGYAFVFGGSLQRDPLPAGGPAGLADYRGSFSNGDTRLETLVSIPAEYTTRLVAYEIIDDASVPPYTAYVSTLDATQGVKVLYVLEKDGSREMGELSGFEPSEIQLQGGAKVYFLVSNSAASQGSVTVVLEKEAIVTTQSYSYSFTSQIYNRFFSGNASFTLNSSVPFVVNRELLAPNDETFVLDIKLTDISKGATISVEGSVGEITIRDPESLTNLVPTLGSVQWYVTGVGLVPGGSAQLILPPKATSGGSLNFEVLINCVNSQDTEKNEKQCGSGTLVMISVGP